MWTRPRARRRPDVVANALASPEQRMKNAALRLLLAKSALAREDIDTARYHARRGLDYLTRTDQSQVACDLRAALRLADGVHVADGVKP